VVFCSFCWVASPASGAAAQSALEEAKPEAIAGVHGGEGVPVRLESAEHGVAFHLELGRHVHSDRSG
jgi:hypothetical protein